MRYQTLAAAAALAMGMSSAQAANYSFVMPISPAAPFSDSVIVSGVSFWDDWEFTAPTNLVSGGALSVNIQNLWNITDLTIKLLDSSNNVLQTGATGTASWLFNLPVTSGDVYSFEVSGNVSGSAGGAYVFSAVAAIPEPGTYTMLLAGLGVVGFIAFRRRQDD